jgi:hypothetical protein
MNIRRASCQRLNRILGIRLFDGKEEDMAWVVAGRPFLPFEVLESDNFGNFR